MNTTTKAETVERVTSKHPAPEGALPTYAGHTPGPWAIRRGHSIVEIITAAGLRIAQTAGDNYWSNFSSEADANARLIAAAPDLLAERDRLRASDAELVAALRAAGGYLLNAKIDLEMGSPKATAIKTIEGGLKRVRAVLDKRETEGT